MIKSLRILEKRNGEKVLQMAVVIERRLGDGTRELDIDWRDVPLVKEGEDE